LPSVENFDLIFLDAESLFDCFHCPPGVKRLAGKHVHTEILFLRKCMDADMTLSDEYKSGNPPILRNGSLISKNIRGHDFSHIHLRRTFIQEIVNQIHVLKPGLVATIPIQDQMHSKTELRFAHAHGSHLPYYNSGTPKGSPLQAVPINPPTACRIPPSNPREYIAGLSHYKH
jgi:hypothetical protein